LVVRWLRQGGPRATAVPGRRGRSQGPRRAGPSAGRGRRGSSPEHGAGADRPQWASLGWCTAVGGGGRSAWSLGAKGAGRKNPEDTPKTSRSCSTWAGVSPHAGTPPDAGRRSARACRRSTARSVSLPRPGQAQRGACDAARPALAGTGPPSSQVGVGRCGRAGAARRAGGRWRVWPGPAPQPAPRRGGAHRGRGSGSLWQERLLRQRAGRARVVRAWRCAAAGWREATAAEAVSHPTRHRGKAGGSGQAVGSPGVGAWSGGRSWGEVGGASRWTPVPAPTPNKGLHLTASSRRSCVAPASGSR